MNELEKLKEPVTAVRLTDYSKGYGDGWNRCIDHLAEQGLLEVINSWRDYMDDKRPKTQNDFLRVFDMFSNRVLNEK
jgi:hypothetical protein